ncbi:MAG: transcriptional repressor, partial [Lachnospiraceae bacterium]|nr:transcriptional repressor [Lachnospiraceae bacterium]
MIMKAQYRTKQRDEILSYIKEVDKQHFTAADIRDYFSTREKAVSTTTIYRQLEKMVDEGILKKYFIEEGSCACFEYVDPEDHVSGVSCYHCKCERCGMLIHMNCEEITGLQKHLMESHHFQIDPNRTVFYGICRKCLEAETARQQYPQG